MASCQLPHVNAILPRPDVTHPPSALLGVAKRMAYKPRQFKRRIMRRFRKFVRKWIVENLTPLDENEQFDIDDWLDQTNYPAHRKEQLKKTFAELSDPEKVNEAGININAKVKFFTKEEWYPEYKHHRGIWAREDAFKAICGPFFKKVESELFKNDHFIKKIPVEDRPDYIKKFLEKEGFIYMSTDFTAYESHFVTEMMKNCEFELYKYMACKNAQAQKIVRLIFNVIANHNYVQNKYFTISVHAKRMSGEMNTSLGNGFSNLMFLLFACYEYRIPFTGPIVEGDDGLMGLQRPIPQQYFDDMGLNVKMEKHDELSEASFCGMVFDLVDKNVIVDPRKALATFPWVGRRYAQCGRTKYLGLIKCKALSLVYGYPGCPILQAYGHKMLSLLHDIPLVPYFDSYYMQSVVEKYLERYSNKELPFVAVGHRTRALMEKLFNISVEKQLLIEKDIDNMTLDYFDTHNVLSIMPELWIENYRVYTMQVKQGLLPSMANKMFDAPTTRNRYYDKLFLLENVGAVKHKVGMLIPFGKYARFKRFVGLSRALIFAKYLVYVYKFIIDKRSHLINMQPVGFGKRTKFSTNLKFL